MDEKSELVEKWRPKALQSIAWLEMLHDICLDQVFKCKEWDAICSAYEVKFPLPLRVSDGNAENQDEATFEDEENANAVQGQPCVAFAFVDSLKHLFYFAAWKQ